MGVLTKDFTLVGGGGGGVTSVVGRTGDVTLNIADITNLTTTLAGKVPVTRTITTTLPLTGGGALSGNLTLAINAFDATHAGIVPASGGLAGQFLQADGNWVGIPGAAVNFVDLNDIITGTLVDGAHYTLNYSTFTHKFTLDQAVSANTHGKPVKRDSNGDFSANHVTVNQLTINNTPSASTDATTVQYVTDIVDAIDTGTHSANWTSGGQAVTVAGTETGGVLLGPTLRTNAFAGSNAWGFLDDPDADQGLQFVDGADPNTADYNNSASYTIGNAQIYTDGGTSFVNVSPAAVQITKTGTTILLLDDLGNCTFASGTATISTAGLVTCPTVVATGNSSVSTPSWTVLGVPGSGCGLIIGDSATFPYGNQLVVLSGNPGSGGTSGDSTISLSRYYGGDYVSSFSIGAATGIYAEWPDSKSASDFIIELVRIVGVDYNDILTVTAAGLLTAVGGGEFTDHLLVKAASGNTNTTFWSFTSNDELTVYVAGDPTATNIFTEFFTYDRSYNSAPTTAPDDSKLTAGTGIGSWSLYLDETNHRPVARVKESGGSLYTFNFVDKTYVDSLVSGSSLTAGTGLGITTGVISVTDPELLALLGVTSAANKLFYFTGSGTGALADFTAAGRALVDDADATAQRATLGLVIGTDVQAQDAELQAIAGLTSAANKLPYFTGSGTAALADFTSAGRALVDDADASAQRTTLGLGTMATQNANAVAITGGSVDLTQRFSEGMETVGFSAIPSFSVGSTAATVKDFGTITANVAMSSYSGTPTNGQLLTVRCKVDSTGGYTFTLSSKFLAGHGPGIFASNLNVITGTPNAKFNLVFRYDGGDDVFYLIEIQILKGLNPNDFGSLIQWVDPAQIGGLNDGDAVPNFNEMSATATLYDNQGGVTWKANWSNGQPSLHFRGTGSDGIKSHAAVSSLPTTFTQYIAFSRGNNNGLLVSIDDNNSPRIMQLRWNASATNLDFIDFNTVPTAFTATASVPGNSPTIICIQRTSSTVDIYDLNGGQIATTASTGTNNSGNHKITLGNADGGGNALLGDIGQWLFYNAVHSAATRNIILGGLRNLFAIS
jgi:hypothetical protein